MLKEVEVYLRIVTFIFVLQTFHL